MKTTKFLLVFLFALIGTMAHTQGPAKFSYQAVVRNADGTLLSNAPVSMEVEILQGSPTGVVFYSEDHSLITNDNGLVTAEIGGGEVNNGNMESIDWSTGLY